MIAIISCGKLKQSKSCQAKDMYTGSYHRLLQRYALSLCDNVYILSAKYGLLSLADKIEPYELRLDQDGCIDSKTLKRQVLQKGLENENIIALGGKDYVKLIKQVWQKVECPLDGIGGIGKQMKWLNEKLSRQERLF